jgi:hypothetical protein
MRRKEMKKLSILTITLTVILATSISGLPSMIRASSLETLVYVDPPEVRDLTPSQNFTIYVKVSSVENLYGLDVQFTWDPTIIQYVSHHKHIPRGTKTGQWPDGVLYPPTIPVKDDVNENANMPGAEPGTRYWLAEASLDPAPVFNGNGTIFEMTFHVVGLGSSPLRIVSCTLADKSGNPIPITIQNGVFVNYVPPPPPPADIYINPPRVVNSSLNPCGHFNVSINTDGVQNLYAYDFQISYNGTLLEVSNVFGNPLFPPPTVQLQFGRVRVTSALTPPAPPINGSLQLATIEFHVLAKGESILDLHNVSLTNNAGEPITYNEPGDGYFNNKLITKMFVYPPELIDPTMKPGDRFTIDIMIADMIDMYDYEFTLGYDTDVLTCLGAIIIPPNSDPHFTVQIRVDDTAGTIRVYVQHYPPAEPISILGAKAVTEIAFIVQDFGQTPLDLYDTRISDVNGNNVSHVVEDGFFATLIRDVAIVSINITSSNIVYPGRIVTIEVVAMNRGNMTTETFNVTLHYSDNIIGTEQVTLAPWTNITITFSWNTSGLTPCNNFTIWAEASPVPYEINLANNVLHDGWVKIKMIGDVNGDGVINIQDIVLITLAYGSQPGDPNWNPDADISKPWNIIDILDLVTCSAKYGWHC